MPHTPTWVVLDPEYNDQQMDPIPAGPDYLAQIGPDGNDRWSVTILRWTEIDGVYDIESAQVPDEDEAKSWAANWRPSPETEEVQP